MYYRSVHRFPPTSHSHTTYIVSNKERNPRSSVNIHDEIWKTLKDIKINYYGGPFTRRGSTGVKLLSFDRPVENVGLFTLQMVLSNVKNLWRVC